MQLKYIIIDHGFPVLFLDALQHKQITVAGGRVTSAGFFKIKDGQVTTYGESISLRLKPMEGDAEIINMMLGLGKQEKTSCRLSTPSNVGHMGG